MGSYKLTASIVTFHNAADDLKLVFNCLLNSDIRIVLYVSDNSSDRSIEKLCTDSRIRYIYNNSNPGFGAAHNIAIKKALIDGSDYHLVLNPDVEFDNSVIKILIQKMNEDPTVGIIMPKILNKDLTVQLLPKLLPSPFNLLIRVAEPLKTLFHRKNSQYVLESYPDKELNVPIISGCFSLFNSRVFNDIGYYDERFFMYFEDFDLSRRIHSKYKTIYCPSVYIIHAYERGAAKSIRLFKIFVRSAIKYFNKYGWFIDNERKKMNLELLRTIKIKEG